MPKRLLHLALLSYFSAMTTQSAFAEVRVSADISASEIYTDNVNLNATKRSDWVTEVTPGLQISSNGARFSGEAMLSLRNEIHTSDTEDNSSVILLSGTGKLEAIEKFLFVDANVGITRQNTSSFGPNAQSYNSDQNQTQVITGSLSPYFNWRFGSAGEGTVRYMVSYANSDDDALNNNIQQAFLVDLHNSKAWGRLGWGVTGNLNRGSVAQGGASDQESSANSRSFRGTLTYAVNYALQLRAFGGREYNDYDGPVTTTNWGGGFTWQPSDRTKLSAEYSKRFFGNGYNVQFSERFRRGAMELGLSRDVTSAYGNQTGEAQVASSVYMAQYSVLDQALQASITDPTARQLEVNRQLALRGLSPYSVAEVNYLSSTYTLQNRAYATFLLNGVRNSASLALWHTKSKSLQNLGAAEIVGDFALFNTVTVNSASLNWINRLTPNTSVTMSALYSESKGNSGTGAIDNEKQQTIGGTLSLDTKLGVRSVGGLSYSYTHATGGTEYVENAVTARFAHNF